MQGKQKRNQSVLTAPSVRGVREDVEVYLRIVKVLGTCKMKLHFDVSCMSKYEEEEMER